MGLTDRLHSISFLVALLFLVGCSPTLVELQNTQERIWVMSRDGKEIYRCYDMTTPGMTTPTAQQINVICQQASIYTERPH